MPDEIDRLVDQETMLQNQALKEAVKPLKSTDKALLDEGVMTHDAAVELTNQIRSTVDATYVLIYRAYKGKCWKALDYDSWGDYVTKEFDMSRSRSYQLINQAQIVQEIEQSVPEGTKVTISEAQARDIEHVIPKITEKLKAKTANQTPKEAAKSIKEAVNEVRAEKKASKEGISVTDGDDLDREARKAEAQDPANRRPNEKSSLDDTIEEQEPIDTTVSDENNVSDDNNDTIVAEYLFSYASSLGNARKTALNIDNKEQALKDAKKLVEWLNSFITALK